MGVIVGLGVGVGLLVGVLLAVAIVSLMGAALATAVPPIEETWEGGLPDGGFIIRGNINITKIKNKNSTASTAIRSKLLREYLEGFFLEEKNLDTRSVHLVVMLPCVIDPGSKPSNFSFSVFVFSELER